MRTPTKIQTTRASLTATATNHSRRFAGLVAGATVAAAPLAHAVDNFWTGATSTNWNEPTNWSLGRVPTNNNGATEGDTFDDAIVNTLTNFPVIVEDLAATPRDIIVGLGADNTGRVDHRAGLAANGGGNWSFVGRAGGTGTYNLADTSASGGILTGFGTGSGSLTVGGRLYIGGNAADEGGNGTLNINTTGTLAMGSDFAVGASGATGLVNMDAGTLNTNGWSFIGKREAFDGGSGTLNLSGGTINHLGSRTFVGLGNAVGKFNISGGTYNALNGGDNNTQFVVGSNNLAAAAVATVDMTGGTINAARLFTIGGTEAFNGDGNPDFINSGKGTMTINGADALLNVTGEMWVSQGANSVGILNLTAGTVQVDNWMAVGRNGGNGAVNMSGGSITKTGGGNFIIGDNGTGAINQTGGSISVNNEFWVGQNSGGNGTLEISAGSVSIGNWFAVGRGGTGVVNQTGGTITKTGNGGVSVGNFEGSNGTFSISGGLFDVQSGDLFAGEGGNGSGTITISATGEVIAPIVRVGAFDTVIGTLNLDGGILRTGSIDGGGGSGTSNVDFNGTQIVATSSNAAFIANIDAADVEVGGVKIDTNATAVGVSASLLDGGGGGGLVKTGTGTLNLNAFNTYTGGTLVSEGTLGGIGTVGAITVEEGADLNPGVATGVLAADSVSFTGAATLTIDADDTAPVAVDRLDVLNNLNLTNASLVLNGDFTSKVYVLASYGSLTGTFPAPTLPVGYSINYAFNGNQIALTRPGTAFDTFIEGVFPFADNDPAFLAPAADPDGDGTENLLEFALGGNPDDAGDGPKVYQLTADSNDEGTAKELLLTIAVRSGTPAFSGTPSPTATIPGATYTVEGSTDLASFDTPVTVVAPVTTGLDPAPDGYEYRTFSLSGSDGLPSRGFLRVDVTP